MWFEDSHILNDYFDFQHEDVKTYWQEILSTHGYYRLGKLVPAKLVSKLKSGTKITVIVSKKNYITCTRKFFVK